MMNNKLDQMIMTQTSTVREALEQLNVCSSGTLFCVDDSGCLVGVLTDGDVRRKLLGGVTLESKVSEVMNQNFYSMVQGDMTPEELAELPEKIKYLPVIDELGKPVDCYLFEYHMAIPVAKPQLGGNEGRYVAECIATGWISSQGKFVKRFEEEFAAFCGTRFGISTCNGTVALHLALVALGVGHGDEVILPSLTFAATANAVIHSGAKPVLVDSEMETWNIDPKQIELAITDKTKAILPVHLYGQPADMDLIMDIANKNNLLVLEDAAEAHGAKYRDKVVGGIGRAACFSFFGNKILTTGEGGMLVTNDEALAVKARFLRDHGMDSARRYWHPEVGFNYRMTNLQAAVGCAQLEKAEEILGSKRRIRDWYAERLSGMQKFSFPPENEWSENVYWMYSIIVDKDRDGISRDEIMSALKSHNIEARPFFNPLHIMPPYNAGQHLPCAEYLGESGLNLPSYVGLTENEVDRVCAVIQDIVG